jgi:DNA-binding NtrC family response regulator
MEKKILVVDDDATARRTLERYLAKHNYNVVTAANGNEGLLAVEMDAPDIVLSDIYMPMMTGLEMLRKIHDRWPELPVIMMTGQDDMPTTVEAMQNGAHDYVVKPIDLDRLQKILDNLAKTNELAERLAMLVEERASEYQLENVLVGRSQAMREIYKTIGSVSRSRVTVLITGESGTGKELIARATHFSSPWKAEPFIAINCTALTESLLESELFGHVRGAFTGAHADKRGKFELAGEGTIFLDEIGEISPAIQVMLLRILQEREFERVGGEKTIPMRARVIAATNRDLRSEVASGNFREDLFYRLNVVSIHVPPIRERKEDLTLIVEHLVRRINEKLHTHVTRISEEAMEKIIGHDWPGNVREMENVLTRAIVLAKSGLIDRDAIPEPAMQQSSETSYQWKRTLEEVERYHIARVLEGVGNNRAEAARVLGISKPTLYSKLPPAKKEEGKKEPE